MRAVRRLVAPAALIVAALAACDSLLTSPTPYGTVRVRAITRDSVPLPGVDVLLYTGARPMGYGRTDETGRHTFSLVPRQEYGVLMTIPAHYATLDALLPLPAGTLVDGISVVAGTDTTFTFVFLRRGPGAVEAHVIDQDSLPFPGVTVELYGVNGILAAAVSNAQGIARFENVAFGQYGVLVATPSWVGGANPQYITRDGLAVELGVTASATVLMNRCFGAVQPTVRDQFNAVVAGVTVELYRFDGVVDAKVTSAAGSVTFTPTVCGNYGVRVVPAPGFTVTHASGQGYVDGLAVSNNAALTPTLLVTRD